MKIHLVTYADKNYTQAQDKLVASAKELGCFDVIHKFGFNDIDPDFYECHKHILQQPKGGGYWLWKPHLILRAMALGEMGDIFLYMDSGDGFIMPEAKNLKCALLELMRDKDMMLTIGGYRHGDWTKRDAFVYMGLDDERFHNAPQLEAGVCVFKATKFSAIVLNLWMMYCTVDRIVTDLPNQSGRLNLDGFKEHRWDQSVLTNLHIAYDLYASSEIRPYIKCNVNSANV